MLRTSTTNFRTKARKFPTPDILGNSVAASKGFSATAGRSAPRKLALDILVARPPLTGGTCVKEVVRVGNKFLGVPGNTPIAGSHHTRTGKKAAGRSASGVQDVG